MKLKALVVVAFVLVGVPSWGQQTVTPSYKDVSYGNHKTQVVDVYLPKSDKLTPAMIYIHGGGWTGGDKRKVLRPKNGLKNFLAAGISVVAINYRYTFLAQAAI